MRAGWLAFVLGALRALVGGTAPPDARADEAHADPRRYDARPHPRAELAVAALLVLGGLLWLAFAVLIIVHADTQLLGIALAGGLACVGAALALASKRLVPQEVDVEHRDPVPPVVDAALTREVHSAGEGISRRRVLAGAAGVAGCGLVGALVAPLTALGPNLDGAPNRTPWRRGRHLVDTKGKRLRAADIAVGSFYNVLPEGDPRALEELGAPIVVVRVEPATLDLPPGRADWAPDGILAFSQICTHAGCAVSLFRYPVDEETSKPPALVCPCHYSTFDVRRAAKPVFGPAVRPLPQLPLAVDGDGFLVASGPLAGSVGPSWAGVRRAEDLR
ncbi:MAG: ubiquinol-cytochrome c reductase iron-sulfur subunit [Solirubrobacteraceae bacterium]|nr:ubiquinol-cytochrome c reductase iron-sulfur subunit [Solirubrobacteraceae bacterium]